MPRKNRVTVCALLLLASACGESGVGPDSSPEVFLQSIGLEGLLQNSLQAPGFARDDGGLDSLRVFLDGEHNQTVPLFGLYYSFLVSIPDLSPGEHLLQLTVFDKEGQTATTSGSVTVPDPVPVYDATVYMMRHDKIRPEPGVSFCLDEFCAMTDSEGKVVLRDLPVRNAFEVGFIEGAHPHYLAAIGKNRLDRNIINYVNSHALTGLAPLDTAVHVGVNERTIIYIDSLTVPIQEFIDRFHQEMGENFNFMHPDLELLISDMYLSVDQVIEDSLKAAAYRGLAFANARFQDVPFDNPNSYEMDYSGRIPGTLSGEQAWGKVIIYPVTEGGLWGGSDLDIEGDGRRNFRSIKIYVNVESLVPWGLRGVQYYIEGRVGGGLTGVAWAPPASYGTFISFLGGDLTQLDRTWTEKDRQVAIIDLMFDTESPFTPSGHDPTSPLQWRGNGRGSWARSPGG